MALTTAQDAFKSTSARAVTAMVFHPTDPNQDDVERLQPISDHRFDTSPTDTLPGLSFKALIADKSGVKLSESLTQSGQLTGESKFAAGRVIVDVDQDTVVDWLGYDWNGTAVEIYLGAIFKADGTRMAWDDFDLFFEGAVDEMRAIGDGQVEITFGDLRLNLDKEFSQEVYKGFGGAFPIRTNQLPPLGTYLTQDHDPEMDVTGSLTIEWMGHVEQLNANNNGALIVNTPILMNGDNGLENDPSLAVNYMLLINEQLGQFGFAGGLNGLNESSTVNSGHSIVLGEPTYFAVTVAADGVSVTFYACKLLDESPVEVGTATLPFALATGPTDGLQIGMSRGSHFVTYEMRVWEETRTLDQLRQFSDGPITTAATDFPTMLEMWRFSENTEIGLGPEVIFGEKGVIDLRHVGDDPVWEASYTGDDPDLFAGSVAGKSRAITYGRVNNIKLARISTPFHVFGWDSIETTDVVQLRMSGVPMVPDYTITSIASGDFVFDEDENTITLTDSALGTFSKFIPGQLAPARLGQRIEIENATNIENRGVFRVEIDGISEDGLVLTVADRTVVDETAPAGTKIASYSPDIQYRMDLEKSVVVLLSEPIGDVTADIIGRVPPSGTPRWTEVVEMILGEAPDTTAVTFDPEVGIHLEPGSGITTNQIMDELARCAFGWWVENPSGGGYRIGNFAPPSGTPVEDLGGPEILDVEPQRSLKPFYRFSVGYARMWHTQDADRLATSVSQADAQRFATAYTYELSVDQDVLDRYPNSTEHDDFETCIYLKSDAVDFKDLAKSMLGEKRWWFKLQFSSFWPLNIRLYDVIHVTWDDRGLGLVSTPCRVVARDIDTGAYSMTLEVHT